MLTFWVDICWSNSSYSIFSCFVCLIVIWWLHFKLNPAEKLQAINSHATVTLVIYKAYDWRAIPSNLQNKATWPWYKTRLMIVTTTACNLQNKVAPWMQRHAAWSLLSWGWRHGFKVKDITKPRNVITKPATNWITDWGNMKTIMLVMSSFRPCSTSSKYQYSTCTRKAYNQLQNGIESKIFASVTTTTWEAVTNYIILIIGRGGKGGDKRVIRSLYNPT